MPEEQASPTECIATNRKVGLHISAKQERDTKLARLEESHRLLQMAESLAGVGHWRLDAINLDLFWSSEVFRIHGREIHDMPSLEYAINAYHPDDQDVVQRNVDVALSVGTPWTTRARLLLPNDEIRHIESSGQAEFAPDGRIIGVFGIFRDITKEVVAEDTLIAARDEARASAGRRALFWPR